MNKKKLKINVACKLVATSILSIAQIVNTTDFMAFAGRPEFTEDPERGKTSQNQQVLIQADNQETVRNNENQPDQNGSQESKELLTREKAMELLNNSEYATNENGGIDLVIPECYDRIDKKAFAFCENLRKVFIPETVTTIGKGAFYNCKQLSKVNIGKGVTKIEDKAFKECLNLYEVQVPDGVTSIGKEAFFACGFSDINIPASVTDIGSAAFARCRFERVVIPINVIKIAECTFHDCWRLEEVRILGNVTTIERGAFCGCDSLKQIKLPDSLRAIEEYAFNYSGIEKVEIPKSVEKIGKRAFLGTKIKRILVIPRSYTRCMDEDFICYVNDKEDYIYPKGGDLFCFNTGNLKTIEELSFGDELEQITIPSSVTKIDKGAFAGCSDIMLNKITIPSSVIEIGKKAFYGCSGLEEVDFEEGGSEELTIGSSAFEDCIYIKEIFIPDRTTKIGIAAFAKCTSLESVTIPTSIIQIDERAFAYCKKLNRVDFAELSDSSLINNSLPDLKIGMKAFSDTGAEIFGIPGRTISIGQDAFSFCYNLKKVIFCADGTDGRVLKVENRAFSSCNKLETVDSEDSIKGRVHFGHETFMDCDKLQNFRIANGKEVHFGKSVFCRCKNLRNVKFFWGTNVYNDPVLCNAFKDTPFYYVIKS